MCHSKVLFCCQPGRKKNGAKMMETLVASGQKVHWLWEVEIVSKTLYWVLCVCVCVLLTKYGCSENNHSDHFLLDSNYDKKFYCKRFWVPTDSSPNPEDHPYGLEDPGLCPDKVSHGSRHKVFLRGQWFGCKGDTMGCLWIGGPWASMCMACCPGLLMY